MRIKIISLLIISFLILVCSLNGFANPLSHPVNQYFNSLEYPRVGLNQVTTSRLKQKPDIINNAAKLDMVIINKSDDLFVDKGASTQYARKIKAINPKVKVLQYLNISDIWNYQNTFDWAQHQGILLKDASGTYIHPYSNRYGNKRYMFDSTQPAWQDYYAKRMKKITDEGMDGIFADNLWRSNWQNLNISSQKFRQIQQGWEKALQKGRSLIGPNKVIVANSPPDGIYQVRDMAMLEGRLQPNRKSLDEYFKATGKAKSYNQIIFDTVRADAYEGEKFHYVYDFFLPVVLLTDNIWGIPPRDQWFNLVKKVGKIGRPLSSAKRTNNGVLYRDFTRGKVIFNDTETFQKISLPANVYKTIDNVKVNNVTLQPMTGVVLKKR